MPSKPRSPGTLEEHPPGSGTWRARVTLGYDDKNVQQRASTTFHAPSEFAAKKLRDAWAARERKAFAERPAVADPDPDIPEIATLGELMAMYFELHKGTWLPTGVDLRAMQIEGYLAPWRGERLRRKNPEDFFNGLYMRLLVEGATGRDGKPVNTANGCLAKPTIARLNTTVKAAMAWGIRKGMVPGPNPLADKDSQRWRKTPEAIDAAASTGASENDEGRVPEQWEVNLLVAKAVAVNHPFQAGIQLAAGNGPRRGEIVALQLLDVNLAARRVSIARRVSRDTLMPGTKDRPDEVRVIPVTAEVAEALRAHIERMQDRAAAAGVDLRPNAFLFSDKADGSTFMWPSSAGRSVSRLCAEVDVAPFGLQGMRRRVSQTLVDNGTMPRDLMALMGHSWATANLYYNKSTDASREAAIARVANQPRSTAPGGVVPLRKVAGN